VGGVKPGPTPCVHPAPGSSAVLFSWATAATTLPELPLSEMSSSLQLSWSTDGSSAGYGLWEKTPPSLKRAGRCGLDPRASAPVAPACVSHDPSGASCIRG
jgi:hypothetical protein